jgi:hypothetical protein
MLPAALAALVALVMEPLERRAARRRREREARIPVSIARIYLARTRAETADGRAEIYRRGG